MKKSSQAHISRRPCRASTRASDPNKKHPAKRVGVREQKERSEECGMRSKRRET
ncbi:hypothetical protein HETIRDRAFT_408843 [Heterobasidion irregulare TC 32-1]|uniref:Uncharacterized protein n=1 Tax=Heterobasidion irregulare (strain TC 32-1) TaxID=747525 RepID=W4KA47_HETIT|nr:uncharacterized protein HETIRDRAFT_408843 [Heterobasidion irregulare TC 32-1]ETW82653.1 hypothetical protein HETIRDRAFT_408843 [Heterobasidion irregulare TC 32-1]